MGPVKSKKATPDLPSEEPLQSLEIFNQLPDELLELILSWLPGPTLLARCCLVCCRWRDLIGRPTLWKLQWERDPALKAALKAAQHCPKMDWGRVTILKPFERNLIKNPCGRERFHHWKTQHQGSGWSVEASRSHVEGAEDQTCFVSSFGWCEKSQLVDLLREGLWEELLDTYQPDIVISDWWGARQDCGCTYESHICLLAADRTSVITEWGANPDPIPQWNNEEYQQVSHVFQNYGPGVRYVRFSHRGKDTQFWAGHYGARITNSTVLGFDHCQKLDMGPVKSKNATPDLPSEEPLQSLEIFNQLPDEHLELILSWVPGPTLLARCCLVCRRWRDLIGRPTLWKLQWERDPALRAALKAAQHCPKMGQSL